jgi:hypothetical protein
VIVVRTRTYISPETQLVGENSERVTQELLFRSLIAVKVTLVTLLLFTSNEGALLVAKETALIKQTAEQAEFYRHL